MSLLHSARRFPADRHRLAGALLGAAVLVCGASFARADRVLFDFEPAYLHQPGYTVKDHDLVLENGAWHAFYIRGVEGIPGTTTEVQLGHASTEDLRNWIVHEPALVAGPEPWDLSRVWAPDVRKEGPDWSMYYTGVSPDLLQRTGIATSPDLGNWTKSVSNPAVEPDSTVYLWSPDLAVPELSAFRDPFRFQVLGEEHLLHTALIPDGSVTAGRRGVIHHLVDDAGTWVDVGPLAVNNNPVGAWRELESVQLHHVDDRWHLFFTYFGVGGIYWTSNDSLDTGWDISSAIQIDPGVGAEISPAGDGDWILTRHGADTHASTHPTRADGIFFVLRADTLRFLPYPSPPEIVPESSFDERWPEREGLAFLASPTFGDNFLERGGPPIGLIGNGYLSSIDLYDGPFGQYGAPGAVVGESATGIARSRWFSLASDDSAMTMLLAGPTDSMCAVYLVERLSGEGEPLVTATRDSLHGPGLPLFSAHSWDVRPWRGRTVRLEVTDLSDSGWIALDHVRVFSSDPIPTPAPPVAARPSQLVAIPNPFNPRTELRWELDVPGRCELEIFDLRGRRVRKLEAGQRPAGTQSLTFAPGELASGTYLVRLIVDGRAIAARKVSLVR